MKIKIFFCTLILFSGVSLRAQSLAQSVLPFQKITKVENARPITGSSYAEAFPWISADGLRLYTLFVGMEQKKGVLYRSRKTRTEDFSNPQWLDLSRLGDMNITSFWWDVSETYFFVTDDRGGLFKGVRVDKQEGVHWIEKISLEGPENMLLLAPSFTPDFSQLFVWSVKGERRITMYERQSDGAYLEAETLIFPENLRPSAGQLSKDGLHYYLSILDKDGQYNLYQLSRPDFNTPFGLPQLILDLSEQLIFPSVTTDGQTLALVGNSTDHWDRNRIQILERGATAPLISIPTVSEGSIPISKPAALARVFPNPAKDQVTMVFPAQLSQMEVAVELSTIDGQRLKVFPDLPAADPVQLSLEDLPAGIYLLSVINSEQYIEPVRLLKY